MSRVSHPGCFALFLSLLLVLPLSVTAQEQSSSPVESQTKSEEYLSQSLDTQVAGGQEQSSPDIDTELGNDSGSSMTWFFIKVVLGLGVILGVIWILSKILEQSGMAGTGNEVMGVRSTLSIGQNQYLQIVQVGPRYLMLGVTENSVTKLDEITDSDTIEALQLTDEQTADGEGPRGFGEIISNIVGTKNHDFSGQETSDYLNDLTNRVSQLADEGDAKQ